MRQCVVHIGMHKTGTTSIQHSLKDFEDDQFYYARLLGRSNHSIPMVCLFGSPSERMSKMKHRSAGRKRLDMLTAAAAGDLQRSIEAAGERTLIISGEGLSTITQPGIGDMKERLERDYASIRIIGYVREPISFMSSAFQERVRAGNVAKLNVDSLYKSYRKRFEKFDAVFGRDNVTLRYYNRADLLAGDVVRDFAALVGIESEVPTVRNANQSVSRDAVCLIYQYNSYCKTHGIKPDPKELKPFLDKLERPDSPRFRLLPALLEPVLELNRPDIAWMEERLGRPITGTIQQPAEGDISTVADLLAPVPGAREKLLAIFEAQGLAAPAADLGDGGAIHALVVASGGGNRAVMKRRMEAKRLRNRERKMKARGAA